MDFSTVDTLRAAEQGFEYIFQHPVTGEDTDCKVKVVGVGSRPYKQAMDKIDSYKAQCARKRNGQVDDDVVAEMYVKLLADCTKSWTGVEVDGKPVEFTHANAVDMYTKYPVLATQVLGAIHDLEAMLAGK